MKAYLIVLSQHHQGKRIALHKTRLLIGRDERCHIRPNGGGISRLHCAIEREGNHFFLTDLSSTNGTWINGEQVDGKVRLRHEDELMVGPLVLQFILDPPPVRTDDDEVLDMLMEPPAALPSGTTDTAFDLDGSGPSLDTRELERPDGQRRRDSEPLPPEVEPAAEVAPPPAKPKADAGSSNAADDILRRIKDGSFFKPH